MDFRTFVRTLTAHWKLFLGALLACLAGAAALTMLQTKLYQSSATVLISFSGETDLGQVYQGTQAAQERLSSYAAIAGGHAAAQRAVTQFHLPITPDALASETHVEYTPKSTLFTVSVRDTDPNRAAAPHWPKRWPTRSPRRSARSARTRRPRSRPCPSDRRRSLRRLRRRHRRRPTPTANP